MDLPPPISAKSYSEHNHMLAECSLELAEKKMLAASAYLHEQHRLECTDVLDIPITCDGTWSKRGFTATYGVVAIIAWKTGQLLTMK